MTENFSHKNISNKLPPPTAILPINNKLLSVYKLWQKIIEDFPKKSRYSLGGKIDSLFIEILETIFVASYLSKKDKLPFVQKSINKLDLLKFFLLVSHEVKSLDETEYIIISEPLFNIGRMLGGWKNRILKENSPQ